MTQQVQDLEFLDDEEVTLSEKDIAIRDQLIAQQHEWRRAQAAYWEACDDRRDAILAAHAAGWSNPSIAAVLDVSRQSVAKTIEAANKGVAGSGKRYKIAHPPKRPAQQPTPTV